MDPEILRMLSILGRPLTNQVEYSERLVASADEYLRIGGLATLLDLSLWPPALWEQAVQQSQHGVVAAKAFKFFMENYEYELAGRVADMLEQSAKPDTAERMRAVLRMDAPRLVELHARQFLDDGRTEHLLSAAEEAEKESGWRASLVWLARTTALQPIQLGGAYRLLRVLETANQFDAIEQILDIFEKGRVFGEVQAIFRATLLLKKKNYNGALQAVSKLRLADLRGRAGRFCRIHAEAYEGLGRYRDAFKWYREMNKPAAPPVHDKKDFLASIEKLARIPYPALSEDARSDTVMMLGFPRSGTTLLENVLAAHPAIETFEEIPSIASMALSIERAFEAKLVGEARRIAFERARDRYYVELDRRRSKPGARVLVDKMPIRTPWVQILETFFPKMRYIFSIRHPYDVVLSCFKQHFTPNIAMENFRTLEDACDLYDRVMSLWFGVFPNDSDCVLYVRYDSLVTDFENEVRRTLAFLGVDWNDDVLRFAELSEGRRVATPSYDKVRSGLSLGVQSHWKNYRFALDNPHGAKLHKWIDRFGYER